MRDTYIRRIRDAVGQDKRIRRIVYMDKVGEGMQWAG
jgi:hypothetical protein